MAILNSLAHSNRIQCPFLLMFLTISFFKLSLAEGNNYKISSSHILPTVTVRGFLNFKTTVDGTVIVFTPVSEASLPLTHLKLSKTSTEILSLSDLSDDDYVHKKFLNSQEDVEDNMHHIIYVSPPQNSLEHIKTEIQELNIFENKMKNPFLQHISDNVVLPSVGQINNDLDKLRKILSSQNEYPTGLVTVLDGTFVEGSSTTVFETKVTGTYIDGKYAQILQSTSRIVALPSSSFMTTPFLNYYNRTEEKEIKEQTGSIVKDFTNLLTEEPPLMPSATPILLETALFPIPYSSPSSEVHSKSKELPLRTQVILSLTSTMDQPMQSYPTVQENLQADLVSSFVITDETSSHAAHPTQSLENARTNSLGSSFAPASNGIHLPDHNSAVLSMVANFRINTSRTRFLSPRRPSQSVRLNRFKVKLTLKHEPSDEHLPNDEEEFEEELANKREEDFEKVLFQPTTITSEVTLHVGRRKSIRTLTITTSIPLTVNPKDIQSIISSQSTIISNVLHQTISRTYTATERTLKTSVVPIFDGESTTFHTVTESFFIMKIITVYRTLLPGDQTVLESFPRQSEISTVKQEIMAKTQLAVISSTLPAQFISNDPMQTSVSLLLTGNPYPQFTNPLVSLGHALSNNPLAAVYLGLQKLSAQITLYSTVTDTSIYVTTETIYNTKTIRFYDGRSTRYRMISDPVSTKKSTLTTTITSVQPFINTHVLKQQQLQKLIATTELSPLQLQFSTITSSFTTVTTAASLSTRVYTLIYNGFSTKFRTVTSTTHYPTTVTITSTRKVPFASSQATVNQQTNIYSR